MWMSKERNISLIEINDSNIVKTCQCKHNREKGGDNTVGSQLERGH